MKKILKIAVAIVIILGIIGFGIVIYHKKEYDNKEQENKTTNSIKYIEDIPNELSVNEAIDKKYFVYDGKNNRVYNKEILDRFVKNTEINAEERISDEICIVIYGLDGDPIIHYLSYDYNTNKYTYAYDYTRIKLWETTLDISTEETNDQEKYHNIISNDDISGKYYGIEVVKDIEFDVAIISLKAYSNEEDKDYDNIEIARYLLDAEIVENKYYEFVGTIIEAHDKYIIVEPEKDSKELKSSNKIQIDITRPQNGTNDFFVKGNKIKISYNGVILESDPAKIIATKIVLAD